MIQSEAALRIAYAHLYDLLWRFRSPDMCPTADEIERTLGIVDTAHGLGDLVLEVIPSIKNQFALLAIERAAIKQYHNLQTPAPK